MAKKKQNSNGFNAIKSNENVDESPLRLFDEAKETIQKIYLRLDNSIRKAYQFYSDRQIEEEIIMAVDIDHMKHSIESIKTIREVLGRDQMKVAFFGKTSNGKSTVINAILRDRVLPMDYGHTTGCFLQIQGNPENEAFLQVRVDDHYEEKKPIQSVSHIASALRTKSIEYSTLVKIMWPISKCPLLKHQVVLVDSPGVDVEENLDECIDQHCNDADVFVLVCNAKSTLNVTEKNFFHRVNEKLFKPNIFILNNRWDTIEEASKCSVEIKEQHIERAVNFLANELRVTSREEAEQRIFFVSAREVIQARSPDLEVQNEPNYRAGYKDRLKEFENFERHFEESLSKSAVKTKFKKHSERGEKTVNDISNILRHTQELVAQASKDKLEKLKHVEHRYISIQNIFRSNEKVIQKKIFECKHMIRVFAKTEFENEIRCLARVIEDFQLKFSTNPDELRYYKEQLYLHMEESLSENLRSRIRTVISHFVTPLNDARFNIDSLLSEARQDKIHQIVSEHDNAFDMKVYRPYYTGFDEDLEFRFSLSLASIMRKFSFWRTLLSQSRTTISADTDCFTKVDRSSENTPNFLSMVSLSMLLALVAEKEIAKAIFMYGGLYFGEYLAWNNQAKERAFKLQYLAHAQNGLQKCVPIISKSIAGSVKQKMDSSFSDFKSEIDSESKKINDRAGLLKSSLEKLRKCDEFTRELIGENEVLLNEFVTFASSFLTA